MSMKRPLVADTKIAMLKTNYEEKLGRAMEEDRERASFYVQPKVRGYA